MVRGRLAVRVLLLASLEGHQGSCVDARLGPSAEAVPRYLPASSRRHWRRTQTRTSRRRQAHCGAELPGASPFTAPPGEISSRRFCCACIYLGVTPSTWSRGVGRRGRRSPSPPLSFCGQFWFCLGWGEVELDRRGQDRRVEDRRG